MLKYACLEDEVLWGELHCTYLHTDLFLSLQLYRRQIGLGTGMGYHKYSICLELLWSYGFINIEHEKRACILYKRRVTVFKFMTFVISNSASAPTCLLHLGKNKIEQNKTPWQVIRSTFIEKTLNSIFNQNQYWSGEHPISGFVFLSQHNTLLWAVVTQLDTSCLSQVVFPPLPSLLAPQLWPCWPIAISMAPSQKEGHGILWDK